MSYSGLTDGASDEGRLLQALGIIVLRLYVEGAGGSYQAEYAEGHKVDPTAAAAEALFDVDGDADEEGGGEEGDFGDGEVAARGDVAHVERWFVLGDET